MIEKKMFMPNIYIYILLFYSKLAKYGIEEKDCE